ncbi:aldehyde dehydrogenase family protein [Sphaerimonospora cavernae]|uniref:Aldehyde dehydrogenase family protein n=1 Tax=Sphaerimonospora cavernae TaxID=1740611 RepID=A0ABV6U999_9ACTN
MKPAHYVNGVFTTTGPAFPLLSPVDGSQVGIFPEAPRDLVDAAVRAAHPALAGSRGRMSVQRPCPILRRIADGIATARSDEFVEAEAADTCHRAEATRRPLVWPPR